MNRQELSAASSIGLLYLIRMLGLFMVLPVLPIQAQHIQGYTPFLVGVAIGIYGLSQGILQIPFGMLSDRFGRKPLIAIGLTLFVLGSFIAGQAEDMTWLIIGRLLQGCGAIASTLLALMSDLTRVDQRSKSMAIIGIGIAASFGLALILGPLIVTTHGLAGVFNLTGILGLAGLLILLLVIPTPTLASVNLDASVQRSRLSTVVGDHGLWRVNVSVFLLHYMLISGFSVFPLLFQMTGQIPDNDHAFYYLVMLVVSFVLMSPFMWLADRMSDARPILVVMVSLTFVAFFLLRTLPGYWVVLAAVVLFFMAFNLLEVVLPAQVSKISAAGSRGTAMGVYTTCQFLGIFAGGIVSGWILERGDISSLMYANMAITIVWLGICISLPSPGRIGSRTLQLADLVDQSANQRLDALLSVDGVVDVAIIESDQVAYLKVDEQIFDDRNLNNVARQRGEQTGE